MYKIVMGLAAVASIFCLAAAPKPRAQTHALRRTAGTSCGT